MYRMLIVEDEEIEREGLRDLFNWGDMDIQVVGAVESCEDAVDFSTIAENLEYFNIPFLSGQFIALTAEIDDFDNCKADDDQDEAYITTFEVLECIKGFKADLPSEAFYVSEGRFCIIVNAREEKARLLYEAILAYATGLQKKINEKCKINITMGIGRFTARLRISEAHTGRLARQLNINSLWAQTR